MEANKANLPLIKKMLDEVADDASVLAMDREELMEEFMIAYQDTPLPKLMHHLLLHLTSF